MTRMDTNKGSGNQLLLKDEVYAIIGAAMEVHRVLKSGFAEAVYQEALAIEFRSRQIPFEPQKVLRIQYKGVTLEKEYCADFLCYAQIIIDIKAQRMMSGREESQVVNYLRATGLRVGLLINFGDPVQLEWYRFIL